jgi:hypothetical protein
MTIRPATSSIALLATAAGLALLALAPSPARAGFCQCCGSSPLILDLSHHERVLTTGLASPVAFDIDADGFAETLGWTAPHTGMAFLWLDLDHDGQVDDGRELFGTATVLPSGETAENGFLALAVYDRSEFGGDGDGWITPRDLIWRQLQLWLDDSHDGLSDPGEVLTLDQQGVLAIGLAYTEDRDRDGAGNDHRLKGEFLQQVPAFGALFARKQRIEDVFFAVEN